MKIVKSLSYYMALLVGVLLMGGCASDTVGDSEQPLPDGMGRIRITIATPENTPAATRAVRQPNAWEAPDHEWEKLQTFRILICTESKEVVDIISGTKDSPTPDANGRWTVTSSPLTPGNYRIYATANYDDGYNVGSPIVDSRTVQLTNFNGYSVENIPMTGKLYDVYPTPKTVTVTDGTETDAGTITVWRTVGKLEFEFTNETSDQVKILGVEVEPINQASSSDKGIFLFSRDNLWSEANLMSVFPNNGTRSVTATWSLDDTPVQNTAASVSMGSVFTSTSLSWGSKLNATGAVKTDDNACSLQKFQATETVSSKDNAAVVTLKVTPAMDMSFTPKNISFKACRVGTDGGKFDVEAGGTLLAEGVTPPRSNGIGGNHEPPFFQEYNYAISGSATTGEYVVNIYLYGLNEKKEYAFRDVVITGDITNNTGTALHEDLTLPIGATTDVGSVSYTPATDVQTVAANGGTRKLFFYVNETDATFTTTQNQLSIRLKIQRGSHTEELRYGVTTPYTDGTAGGNGFNVIRRNDWIHIPIHLTDWQFRVEPLAFVPIAGYPATTLSSDALTTTFSTGGYIILQPFAQKNNDGTWRDFTDPEVTFQSLTWKNSDGTDVAGTGKIFETAPTYDTTTGRIVAVLNNSLPAGTYMTTITVNVKLGPTGTQYEHAFTFNVILQK